MSAGEPCGADYAVTSAEVSGSILNVAMSQVARREGDCALTEGVCCEHHFNVDLSPGTTVTAVHDEGHPFNPVFFLSRPKGLLELHGLPDGWALRREWASWGGTWTRIYARRENPPPSSTDTLEFGMTFGGDIVTEPEALQPPVLVNGKPAQYHRYPDLGEVSLQWLTDEGKLWLLAVEPHFTIEDLVALAESATAP